MKYGKIESGRLVYFSGNNIVVGNQRVFNPSEDTLATAGYFPVVDIAEDGTDAVITDEESGKSHIAHYIGAPVAAQELDENEAQRASLESRLANTTDLLLAVERMVAANGATDEDKAMAQQRIEMRYQLDELGKIIAPDEPDGSYLAPFRYVEGMEVTKGFFYAVEDPEDPEHPFIKEAIKSGTPANGNDNEYFD